MNTHNNELVLTFLYKELKLTEKVTCKFNHTYFESHQYHYSNVHLFTK
jgi:hypothetical protein